MNVLLMGYRGSGKSSVGKILAGLLHQPLVDTDEEVCRRMGNLSIAEIWERHGEAAFRKTECQCLTERLQQSGQILALGGGTPLQPDARRAMEAATGNLHVYLKCPAQELDRRIRLDPRTGASRPALTARGGSLEEIHTVLKLREPVYQTLAHLTLDAGQLTPDQLARAIFDHLTRHPPAA